MRIRVDLKGFDSLAAGLKDFSERRLKAAAATALTRTAVQARADLQAHAQAVFDRPSAYTLRQLRYVPATAQKLAAGVGFNIESVNDQYGRFVRTVDVGPGVTPAWKYMTTQVAGGSRRNKRFEKALQSVGVLPQGWYAVPGERARLDANGNHAVGEIRQILSWFDAAERVAGSTQNMRAAGRAKRIKGTRRAAGFEYFVSRAGDVRGFSRSGGSRGSHRMQPGIYRRTYFGLGTRIEPIIIFVRSTQYKPRFDLYGTASKTVNQHLGQEMHRAIQQSLARLQAKNAT